MDRQNYIAEKSRFVSESWSSADKIISVNVAYTEPIVWNITVDMQCTFHDWEHATGAVHIIAVGSWNLEAKQSWY